MGPDPPPTAGPCGIPGIPGSRDWTQIPIPGFLKMKSRDFSGFGTAHKTMISNTFIDFQSIFFCLFETPRTFKVRQMCTLQTLVDSTNSYQEFLWSMKSIGLSNCKKVYQSKRFVLIPKVPISCTQKWALFPNVSIFECLKMAL